MTEDFDAKLLHTLTILVRAITPPQDIHATETNSSRCNRNIHQLHTTNVNSAGSSVIVNTNSISSNGDSTCIHPDTPTTRITTTTP